jgi:hypothetical protein
MKTRIQKLLICAALLGATTLVQAQYNYTNNGNGTCTITGYTGPGGAVTIPNSISGLSVVSIGDNAFNGRTSLTSVTIGNSVTNIGYQAFADCSLTSVILPNSIISIGVGAFWDCTSLTSVTIPASVTSIGVDAFALCAGLTAINVDPANSFYSSANGVLFDKNQTTLMAFPRRLGVSSYTIPAGVRAIGDLVFYYCTSLTSVVIPASVISLGYQAFVGCTSLTNITIPNSVTSIGDQAFESCASLTSVAIPASVINIGFQAFANCSSLTAIAVDSANSFYSSANGVLFDKSQTMLIQFPCGLGGSYTIPNSVAIIEDWAFQGCTDLTNVTIPNSVTTIGFAAFNVCLNLTSVTIGYGVTTIGDYAFSDCSSLTSAYFLGGAPFDPGDVFDSGIPNPVTVYYLPGAAGWGPFFSGVPTELWNPHATALSVSGGHFGFNISGPSNTVIVVEACTNLSQPIWLPVFTNALNGSGVSSFSDSESGNYPARFYRFRSP